MQPFSKAEEYVQQVCNEIRWKKAHDVVREELLAHIEDQSEAYRMAGAAEDEADALAVEEMGSPLETGSYFDKLYRPHIEWNVILFVGIIIAVGTFLHTNLMLAAGMESPLLKTLLSVALGVVITIYGYSTDYTHLFCHYFSSKASAIIWTFVCACVLYFLFTGGSIFAVNGEDTTMAYLAILWILALCAFVCMQYQKGAKGYGYSYLFLLFSLCFFYNSTPAFLLILGTGIVLFGYALYQNWFACNRKWGLTLLLLPFTLLIWLLRSPWRLEQLYTAINPAIDPMGTGYLSVQIMAVLQEAQLFGAGGKDLLYAMEHIPAMMSDHILTAMVVHWGWISLLPLLAAYGMMFYLGIKASFRVKSRIGKMLLVTVGAAWMMQLLMYCCTNFTTLQISTYPLLFIQGGRALDFNAFLLGLVLSVFKTGAVQKDAEPLYEQIKKYN